MLAFLSGGGITFCLVQFGELSTAFVERKHINATISYLPLLIAFGGGRQLTNPNVNESNDALMEDGRAMGLGMTASILVSVTLCILSVLLLNWSSLRQVGGLMFQRISIGGVTVVLATFEM
ncbi:hypothetical protein EVAR_67762_1 [Eumeta japonica]|uniref:Uncharacterized protein n=1 Tax=Eumeta variegata TaxID=151549 RepID=A0A4C2A4C9_EUMVA|nr:hypothetical protein EVAR_67762_1 [Eumeta japonica]